MEIMIDFVIILAPLIITFASITKKKKLSKGHKLVIFPYFASIVVLSLLFLFYSQLNLLLDLSDVLEFVIIPTLLVFIVGMLYPIYWLIKHEQP